MIMDVLVAKILIIFGLLISTLLAALLPLLCMKRFKKRRRSRSIEDEYQPMRQNGVRSSKEEETFSEKGPENSSLRSTASEANRRKRRSKLILSSLNCFAGGIFLGTSFIGLLPEIRERFSHFYVKWPTIYNSTTFNGTNGATAMEAKDMPIAEIIVCCGLFFILSIEQAAHSINHWRQQKKRVHGKKQDMHVSTSFTNEPGGSHRESVKDSSVAASIESHHDHQAKKGHDHSAIRSLMLVATLSIHSFLEGIAIGLQDNVGSILAIFIAVLFHKSLMAFSMGTNLVRAKQETKKILWAAIIFSIMSPAGIGLGLIIKQTGGDGRGTDLVNVILQSIATGTFIYITFFEVLVKEFEAHYDRFAKVFFLIFGYGAVLGSFFAQNA